MKKHAKKDPKKDPRFDSYIKDAPAFAKPILAHLRKTVRHACPEAEETIKWGMPHFTYRDKVLCGMGAFKAHCIFGFWKGSLIVDDQGNRAKVAMGQMGRIASIEDLPPSRLLTSYVKQAMKLNEPGAPALKRPLKHKKPPVRPPADFLRALRANRKALKVFEGFSPSHKREYVEWIQDAKTEETRERRLETSVDWIAAGKSRNWKYQ